MERKSERKRGRERGIIFDSLHTSLCQVACLSAAVAIYRSRLAVWSGVGLRVMEQRRVTIAPWKWLYRAMRIIASLIAVSPSQVPMLHTFVLILRCDHGMNSYLWWPSPTEIRDDIILTIHSQ